MFGRRTSVPIQSIPLLWKGIYLKGEEKGQVSTDERAINLSLFRHFETIWDKYPPISINQLPQQKEKDDYWWGLRLGNMPWLTEGSRALPITLVGEAKIMQIYSRAPYATTQHQPNPEAPPIKQFTMALWLPATPMAGFWRYAVEAGPCDL